MHTPPAYPASRPRRLRRDAFTRALVREHRLHASDLILPVFVLAGHGVTQNISSMPGVQRMTLDRLLPAQIPFALLTGATPAPRRRETLERLASGELGLVVGTHALIEPEIDPLATQGADQTAGGGRFAAAPTGN